MEMSLYMSYKGTASQFKDLIRFLSPLTRIQVNLRLILVSGKTQDFTFSPNDSATDIARHVFENWPAGMF